MKSYLFSVIALFSISSTIVAQDVSPTPRNPVIRVQSEDFKPDDLGAGALKIALIGDSLGVPFHITSLWGLKPMIFNMRAGGWFDNSVPNDGLESVYEELATSQEIPTAVMNLAIASSWICQPAFFTVAGFLEIDSMDRQVSRILMEKDFPNLILVWQGHNDADWRYQVDGRKAPESTWKFHREALPIQITVDLRDQLQRLVSKARTVGYPVTILVFGLLNAESSFEIRRQILDKKKKDPSLYPFLSQAIKSFPSLQLEYEKETMSVYEDIAKHWREMVEKLNRELEEEHQRPSVQVIYSYALSKLKFTVEDISPIDGLHFSMPTGHQTVANTVANELNLQHTIEFLKAERR